MLEAPPIVPKALSVVSEALSAVLEAPPIVPKALSVVSEAPSAVPGTPPIVLPGYGPKFVSLMFV